MIDSSSTNDWLKSPDDPPIYSGELVRKRHWLEPMSTRWARESSELSDDELYTRFFSQDH